MTARFTAKASIAAVLVGLSLSGSAAAQTTIFTTTDFRQDRDLWTDPAYTGTTPPVSSGAWRSTSRADELGRSLLARGVRFGGHRQGRRREP